jgi:hypothetical protein
MNKVTPIQRQGICLTFADVCVSCTNSTHYLWNADGFALTDESTSEGFCDACWNY